MELYTLLFLFLWVMCGVIAGNIYSNKGRSAALGCLAGLILGPIGVLMTAASGKVDEEKKALRQGKLKRCAYCAEPIQAEAIVCKHCGGKLP